MRTLTVLLVDDEPLARHRMRKLLEDFQDEFEVTGECANVQEAVEAIRRQTPDLIFLDIQMPGGSGFELFDRLSFDSHVIFVTAYDDHALRAFEVNALDYLMKPIAPERLAIALERARTARFGTSRELPTQAPLREDDRVELPIGRGRRFALVTELAMIVAAGDYTEVSLSDGSKELVSRTLKQWLARLPESAFLQVHRSAVVGVRHVSTVKNRNGRLDVFVRGEEKPITVSRRLTAKVRGRLTLDG